MTTNHGFSSIFFFFFFFVVFLLISIFPLTHSYFVPYYELGDQIRFPLDYVDQVHTNKTSPLSADEHRILKAMMARCVDIFIDPSTPPPPILNKGELGVLKLNIYRCHKFFMGVHWSFAYNVRLTSDYVFVLTKVIPYELQFLELPIQSSSIGREEQFGGDEPNVLKPTMENCVKLYLDNADGGGADSGMDIDFCSSFFNELGGYLIRDGGKLAPQHVAVLKEYRRLNNLYDRNYQICLIYEKYGADYNCDRFSDP